MHIQKVHPICFDFCFDFMIWKLYAMLCFSLCLSHFVCLPHRQIRNGGNFINRVQIPENTHKHTHKRQTTREKNIKEKKNLPAKSEKIKRKCSRNRKEKQQMEIFDSLTTYFFYIISPECSFVSSVNIWNWTIFPVYHWKTEKNYMFLFSCFYIPFAIMLL